jgi:catechol 2,3-dioxygenase-like lactoylglutathione lyase family enzyme
LTVIEVRGKVEHESMVIYVSGEPMSRLQLALNVENLEESIAFYSKLFDTAPAKTKPGYANFAVTEPPLKLILVENPGRGGSLNHLGVEVADVETVDSELARLAEAGFAPAEERGATCCYAQQDKFWVDGAPNGEEWEIYTVLADSDVFGDLGTETQHTMCCGADTKLEHQPTATACC